VYFINHLGATANRRTKRGGGGMLFKECGGAFMTSSVKSQFLGKFYLTSLKAGPPGTSVKCNSLWSEDLVKQ